MMFPKPTPRIKKSKQLRRSGPIGPRTWEEAREMARARRRRPKRKTKHGRRERAWGKMACASHQRCDVAAAFVVLTRSELTVLHEFGLAGDGEDVGAVEAAMVGPCRGRVQVMHLRAQPGQHRAGEDRIAPGCEGHHKDIDGRIGGRGRWYVRLGRLGQVALRNVLTARMNARWEALSPAERERWDEKAATKQKGRTPWT